jgi:CheY-like chemotaxis protein
MRRLLVIEDGDEYAEFARLFLGPDFQVRQARSAAEALCALAAEPPDVLLFDLRFDRAPAGTLVGDVQATARRLFAGDEARALRYLQDQQGVLILGELRAAGHLQPAVFVHEFPPRRLDNLRRLYGTVLALPGFDAAALRLALGGTTP